jgi:hypothetical protein
MVWAGKWRLRDTPSVFPKRLTTGSAVPVAPYSQIARDSPGPLVQSGEIVPELAANNGLHFWYRFLKREFRLTGIARTHKMTVGANPVLPG